MSASATSISQATVGGHAEALRGGGGGRGGGLSETLQIMLIFFVSPQRAVGRRSWAPR
jgi:hypothetical protein